MSPPESSSQPARIVVSMGDPCGIGPELCYKLVADREWRARLGAAMTIVGSRDVLLRAARRCGMGSDPGYARGQVTGGGQVGVIDPEVFDPALAGAAGPGAAGGGASVAYIERAFSEIVAGRADALVTCPVSKQALDAAGCPHPGHTEMLGELAGGDCNPVMMMTSKRLRVAFVTTHLPFRELAGVLSREKVVDTVRIFADALDRYFAVRPVKMALCALNPHAGDGGRFGDEEERILVPALESLAEQGIGAEGPVPADSVFYKALEGRYNGVVALYHDQGMIPVKMHGPGTVVNVTIGLPIIRASPAHGTAYDIAGKGIADPESLKNAVCTAVAMAERDKKGKL